MAMAARPPYEYADDAEARPGIPADATKRHPYVVGGVWWYCWECKRTRSHTVSTWRERHWVTGRLTIYDASRCEACGMAE